MCRCPSTVEFPSVIPSPLLDKFLLQTLNIGLSWHSLRLELGRSGEPKCLYEEKLSRLPGLPYLSGWDIRPPELSRPLRKLGDIHINGCLNLRKTQKKKENSTRVTRVEGCFGFPRPYQWSLSYVHGHSTVPSKHTNTRDKTWNSGVGGQIEVDEYIVQKCRFRLHYERVLYRKQLQLDYERKRARVF